jgi:SAM-dependent methyltransferase
MAAAARALSASAWSWADSARATRELYEAIRAQAYPGRPDGTLTAEPKSPQPNTQPRVHEAILRWFPPGHPARILDAGAGEGALSDALLHRGYRVIASDRDPAGFRPRAIPFVRANLNGTLPFASGSFDGIASVEVLEHLENPHRLAREFARILRPGGTLVITTPNILQVYSRIHYLLLGTFDFFDTLADDREAAFRGQKGHINPVAFPELRYALERAGFGIREVVTNRDIREALHDGTLRMMLVRCLIRPIALLVRAVTRAARRSDPISMRLLEPSLLLGEDLIVVAERGPEGERTPTPAA